MLDDFLVGKRLKNLIRHFLPASQIVNLYRFPIYAAGKEQDFKIRGFRVAVYTAFANIHAAEGCFG